MRKAAFMTACASWLGLIWASVASPALAQDNCRKTSYIPSMQPMVLQAPNGTSIALQRHVRNHRPTVYVWLNHRFAGEYLVPLSLASGEIQVLMHTHMGLETWMGSVRQSLKETPYLVVCGPWSARR
ncbi:MAG TPA: hypothetical protein VJ779_12600 [Acetobacteraceae bacterium]|nr:hypothetical protein [Acetobacteraceae bacterium]